MECIPRCTQLLTTSARSLGGRGGYDARVDQPLSKTFVTALWNLGRVSFDKSLLGRSLFCKPSSHHRVSQTDRASHKSATRRVSREKKTDATAGCRRVITSVSDNGLGDGSVIVVWVGAGPVAKPRARRPRHYICS